MIAWRGPKRHVAERGYRLEHPLGSSERRCAVMQKERISGTARAPSALQAQQPPWAEPESVEMSSERLERLNAYMLEPLSGMTSSDT